MSVSHHSRCRLTFSHCGIVSRDRQSKKRPQSDPQLWLSEAGSIYAAFSAVNFGRICSMPSLVASSVAPFRGSSSGSGNVACFTIWFPICENTLLKTLDFCSSRSSQFQRFSRPLNWSLATRFYLAKASSEGDGCVIDTDHPIRHPSVHLWILGRVRIRRLCAWHDDKFGRGQNTGLGWSDPTFVHVSVPKVIRGVAPAQLRGDRAECSVRATFHSRGPQ